MSYSWRSILKRVDLLKEGLIWWIGNGERVRIWDDPWLPKGLTRKPITPRRGSLVTRVSELINPLTGDWDVELIRDNFWPEDAEEILRIPIDMDMDEWPAWHFDAKGNFSVRSAYKLAVHITKALSGRDDSTSLGMKTDENERENPSTISVSIFYYGKRKRERNNRVRERKRDITVTEMGGNRNIYRNALLLNHHSLSMNITLDTPLHKLFFKNMINISCFLRLKREIYVLMLRNMRGYMVCLFIFFRFYKYGKDTELS